jgi:hypothetical protein
MKMLPSALRGRASLVIRSVVVALLAGAAWTAATAAVAAAAAGTGPAAGDAWSAGTVALLGAAVTAAAALILRGDDETRLAGLRLALALLAIAVQDPRWPTSLRAPVVLAFVAFVPGWALLSMWDLARGWAGAGLAIAVSLALATIVPGALMYAGAWSPFTAFVILVALTVGASAETIGERLGHGN